MRLRDQRGDGQKPLTPLKTPNGFGDAPILSSSPTKGQLSPGKSSLSKRSRYALAQGFDPENGIWSDEEDDFVERQLPPGKSLHRHAKSVTFDAAPPQVNEYEMTTPDPSSIASGSREGSYESVGDEEEENFDRGSSIERDDSFDASLEDTDKTPVVLPEDWRFMSPSNANDDLAAHVEDPFDGEQSSPAPTARPSSAVDARTSPTRTDSANSSGERRPLPPLPGMDLPSFPRPRSDSNGSLSATAERVSSGQRDLPNLPRPASITKAEIQGMGGCSMSLEDRLRLMVLQDEENSRPFEEEQRERRLRRGQSKSPEREITVHEAEVNETSETDRDDVAGLGEIKMPPRISRESILRKVKAQRQEPDYEGLDYDSPPLSPMSEEESLANIDPDVPLPSLEADQPMEEAETSVIIKEEPMDEIDVDLYSIPDLYSQHLEAESFMSAVEKLEEYAERTNQGQDRPEDDDASQYSTDSKDEKYQQQYQSQPTLEEESLPTPRASTPTQATEDIERAKTHRMSLPQFASMLSGQDFGFGMESFMTPSNLVDPEPTKMELPSNDEKRVEHSHEIAKRPVTPEAQLQPPIFPGYGEDAEDEPGTPDSVIRRPIADSPPCPSPEVPERVATIKAPGGKLKTRPSLTPSDIGAMAETRRKVSVEVPDVAPMPERQHNRPSMIEEASIMEPEWSSQEQHLEAPVSGDAQQPEHNTGKRLSSLVKLDIPVQGNDGLGFGLDQEFDRVIEAQKVAFAFPCPETQPRTQAPGNAEYIAGQGFRPIRGYVANRQFRAQKGYLMRQNTKVVVASSASNESAPDAAENQDATARGTRSAGNSPRKASNTKTWTTEPWNGKVRRKSIRQSGGSPQKVMNSGPVPPLPGQQSNVSNELQSVAEDEATLPEEIEDGAERGRLFVKVQRVKDLELPLPRGIIEREDAPFRIADSGAGERSYFALTLDNGLHCVTTAWLELGKTAPIGQEFELVVLNDLEFQLTLQTKIEEPKVKPIVDSPTKLPVSPKKSAFSKVFSSPRKRKEIELKEQEEARKADRQRQQEAQAANRRSTQPTAWDLLHNLVAKDGSFARSYVCLKDHESSAFGRPYTVDVPCFNEWAMEEAQMASSVKSKRSTTSMGLQRKAPYRIGKLELQLFYVPKPKDAKDDDMPKSMNACIRELKEAESVTTTKWEGNLSQQGGDCPVRNSCHCVGVINTKSHTVLASTILHSGRFEVYSLS